MDLFVGFRVRGFAQVAADRQYFEERTPGGGAVLLALVGHLFVGPRLRAAAAAETGDLELRLDGVRSEGLRIERADHLTGGWVPWGVSPSWTGTSTVVRVPTNPRERGFFRARWPE